MDDIFLKHRNLLMALAYRMLGSVMDAEDMVQETYIEWKKQKGAGINSPKAWLIKVCTNKSIDYLRKAYKRREVYIGTWLPEPILNSFMNWDDVIAVESQKENELSLKESLSTTIMILLESMSPVERAVFLLKEVFQYSYNEISQIVEKKEPACRKIFQRSKKALRDVKLRNLTDNPKAQQIVLSFFESAKRGDVDALKTQLSLDSQLWSDGGGKVQALDEVLGGSDQIARFFAKVFGGQAEQSMNMEFNVINNLPGLVISVSDDNLLWKVETVFSFEIIKGKLHRIYAMRNPDKLELVRKH